MGAEGKVTGQRMTLGGWAVAKETSLFLSGAERRTRRFERTSRDHRSFAWRPLPPVHHTCTSKFGHVDPLWGK